MTNTSRILSSLGVAALVILSSGCATTTATDPRLEKPYCYNSYKDRAPAVCTTVSAPTVARDAEAKRFAPSPELLTVYVVRQAQGQGWHRRLNVRLDDQQSFELVPASMVRLRVKPGEHRLAFSHRRQVQETVVRGDAGQVVFAGIDGTDSPWVSSHRWSGELASDTQRRARRARLVADYSHSS